MKIMTINLNTLVRQTTKWNTILLFVIFLLCSTPAQGSVNDSKPVNSYKDMTYTSDIFTILSVLDSRIGDRKLLEKAEAKLLTLNETEIRLISSLCERIAREGDSAGSDIAWSLVMALIVLS